MDKRWNKVAWGPNGVRIRTSVNNWKQPLAWNRAAEKAGVRARVFCASLADVFEDRPELVPWRADLYRMVTSTPWLDWLLLTKRPENIPTMWPEQCVAPLLNVWLGTSVENQATARQRIPKLLECPAAVRFLSCEPLLGMVKLGDFRNIDWIICGGESGPGARPMHPDWPRSLHEQCSNRKIPFLFKQWGDWIPESEIFADPVRYGNFSKSSRSTAVGAAVYLLGKHRTGRRLDGREWNEFPAVAHV